MIELILKTQDETELINSYKNWSVARKEAKRFILENDPERRRHYLLCDEDDESFCNAERLLFDATTQTYVWC